MSALSVLPFEILFEITSYLDKRALKAVRAAAPNSSLYHAASTDLFRSLALRLCTPLWTSRYVKAKLAYLDACRDAPVSLFGVGPQVVRELVVDTRYPQNLSVKPMEARDLGFLPFDTSDMPEDDVMMFAELVKRVVGLAKDLTTVRWRGSNRLSVPAYTALARILCAPGHSYRLNVSFRWDIPINQLGDYMGSLANLSAIGVEWSGGHTFAKRHVQALTAVINRSPNLQSFTLHLSDTVVVFETTIALLWKSVFAVPTLRAFALDNTWKNMPNIQLPTPPHKLDKLRDVTLIAAMNGTAAANVVQKAVQDLHIAAVRPQTFKTNVFNCAIANFVLTDRVNHLTTLDVECHEAPGVATPAQLGTVFWSEVVTRHASSLRVIRGYHRYTSDWAWIDASDNPAKLALDKCTALQELTVTFVDTRVYVTYVLEMLKHLLLRTRRLTVVNLAFPVRTPHWLLEQTVSQLESWESTDARYLGRDMQVRYRTRDDWDVSMYCSLRGRHGPNCAPLLFDDKIQAWELRELRDAQEQVLEFGDDGVVETSVRFERVDDSYIFDDRNI